MVDKNLNNSINQNQFSIKASKASYVQFLAAFTALLGALCVGSILSFTSPALPSMQHEAVDTVHLPIPDSSFKVNHTNEPVLNDQNEFQKHKMFLEESDKQITSWIISIISIGGLIGSIISGSIIDSFGFRYFLCFSSLVCVIGWLFISFSINLIMVLIGRFVTGVAMGFYSVSVNVYINEISTLKSRGFLGCSFQGFITFGILFTTIVGMFFDFRMLSLFCCLPSFLLILLIFFFPESPHWLIKKQRESDALKALKRLRTNSTNCTVELNQIIEQIQNAHLQMDGDSIDQKSIIKMEDNQLRSERSNESIINVNKIIEDDNNNLDYNHNNSSPKNEKLTKPIAIVHSNSSSSFITDLKLPHVYKALIIGLLVMAFQQLAGTNGIFGSLQFILSSTNLDQLSEQQAAFIVNLCFAIFAWTSTYIVNIFGRRTLLLFSSIGYIVSYVLISLHYLAKEHQYDELAGHLKYLPIIGLIMFFFVHAVGYGSVAWFLVPEICVSYRSQISSICTCMNWIMSFVVMKNFTILVAEIDYGYTFLFFAFIGLLSFLSVFFLIPETKDKSAKEIKRQFYAK